MTRVHPRWLGLVLFGLGLVAVAPAHAEDPPGRQYALLIGVRNYKKDELRRLDFTENDVSELAKLLHSAGYRRVVLMTQVEAVAQGDNDLEPTGKNIRRQLKSIVEDCKKEDSLLIAFSGHGVQPVNKGSYLCPMDAEVTDLSTLVSLAEVYRGLDDCKAGTKVLLVDACRNDPLASAAKDVAKLDLESVTRPQMEKPPGGVASLFSCSSGERSYESEKYKHGIFFHYVLEGLQGKAANKKGEVTLLDLASYVADNAPDQTKNEWGPDAHQHPQEVTNLTADVPLVWSVKQTATTTPTTPMTPVTHPGTGKEITNGVQMKLVQIPAGKFTMGSSNSESGHNRDEGPQHAVAITQPFYMATCPVTRAQFASFMKDENYTTDAEAYLAKNVKEKDKSTWRNVVFFGKYQQGDDDPVVHVSANDAAAFCKWLSKKEKMVYELPTEAEWEYACRAGATTAYFFGDDPKGLDDYAWYASDSGNHTHPVGKLKPNAWGLYDMHGNVWQLCADGKRSYKNVYTEDPVGPETNHVLRGGSYGSDAAICRAANRGTVAPNDHAVNYGFRVVMRVPSKGP